MCRKSFNVTRKHLFLLIFVVCLLAFTIVVQVFGYLQVAEMHSWASGFLMSESVGCDTQLIRTYSYGICSIEYIDWVIEDGCLPCAGSIPCIYGIDHNKNVEMLECLCESNAHYDAYTFSSSVFSLPNTTNPRNICDRIPDYIHHI